MTKWLSRITQSIVYGVALVAMWAVLRDWTHLMEIGGWFAVFGQLMAVVSTLVVMFLLGVLCLALLCLPVLLFFSMVGPDAIERLTWDNFADSMSRWLLQIANPVWKILWWTWWLFAQLVSRR